MRPTRCLQLTLVAATVLLVAGTASRRDAATWPRVEPGSAVPAALRAAVLQTLNADGGVGYAIERAADHRNGQAVHIARNDRHALTAAFTSDGLRITAGTATLRLGLAAYGRGDERGSIAMGDWSANGSRIARASVGGAAITEWYINGPLGLEQGFTIPRAPEGSGPVVVELALGAPWIVKGGHESALMLHEPASGIALTYAGLHAFDAGQRPLRAALSATDRRITISVDADAAAYPITIDPFIAQQTLKAFDGEPNDLFGRAVALGVDTAVVGAPDLGIQRGAAYVFVRNNGVWSLQAKLEPNDPANSRLFGTAVAISGETIAVGAINGPRGEPGSVYVFVRSGTVWSQQAKLTAPDGVPLDFLGASVAIDGNTVIGGAPFVQQATAGPGAAYVFVRSGTTWSLQQKLQPATPQPGDRFGESVTVSGDTMIAGAPRRDEGGLSNIGRAFVFVRTGATWSIQQQILAPVEQNELNFGVAAAVSGNRALVTGTGNFAGSSGFAAAFERVGNTWLQSTVFGIALQVSFGVSAALDGATGIVGAAGPVARPDGVVTLVRFPQAGPPAVEFVASRVPGRDVAIRGDTLLLGEPFLSPGEADVLVEQTGAPQPPVVSAPVVTGSTVDLSWTASTGATRYQLRAGTSPGSSNAFNGDVGNVTTLKAVNVPNGSYFIRVFAVNASGESAASNEVRADVGVPGPCTPPAAPANLTRGVNGSLVTLIWSASTGATSYVVEAGSASGLANLAVIDTGSATPGLAANAPPGTYFVRIRAKNSCGLSAPSNQVTVTVS